MLIAAWKRSKNLSLRTFLIYSSLSFVILNMYSLIPVFIICLILVIDCHPLPLDTNPAPHYAVSSSDTHSSSLHKYFVFLEHAADSLLDTLFFVIHLSHSLLRLFPPAALFAHQTHKEPRLCWQGPSEPNTAQQTGRLFPLVPFSCIAPRNCLLYRFKFCFSFLVSAHHRFSINRPLIYI